jgi:hypothetical protein
MILKLQRPVYPPGERWLAYNKGRIVLFELQPTPELIAMMGDRYKMYVEAELEDNGFVSPRPVEDQNW